MTIYCIDTSSLINIHQWRPRRRFPQIWRNLEQLIESERLIAPREVFQEVSRRDDSLKGWARAHKDMFQRNTRELLATAQMVLRKFPDLVDSEAPTPTQADPFVVALAHLTGQNLHLLQGRCVVVTEEIYKPNCTKIPHVCEAYQLQYITVHQMFMAEGWEF